MRNKSIAFALAAVMLLAMLAGCSASTPPSSQVPASPSPSTPAPSASEQPSSAGTAEPVYSEVHLIFQSWSPDTSIENQVFMKEITEVTSGKVTFEPFFGGTLVPQSEATNALSNGVADIGMINIVFDTERMGLYGVSSLPGLQKGPKQQGEAANELNKLPAVIEELAADNIVALLTTSTNDYCMFNNIPIYSVDYLVGKKIAASGDWARVVQDIGGVPVTISSNEHYEALSRGTVDAIISPTNGASTWGLHEVSKYIIYAQFGVRSMGLFMNKDSYEALTDDTKALFHDWAEKYADASTKKFAPYSPHTRDRAYFQAMFDEAKCEVIDWTDE